jgi:hypothetical protein
MFPWKLIMRLRCVTDHGENWRDELLIDGYMYVQPKTNKEPINKNFLLLQSKQCSARAITNALSADD